LHPLNKKPQIPLPLKIIDTFLYHQNKIYLKDLHVQRVFDSFEYFGHPIEISILKNQYDEFETSEEFADAIDLKVRLEYSLCQNLEFKIDILQMASLVEPVLLIPAQTGTQTGGIGSGNFKTTARDYWKKNQHLVMGHPSNDILGINNFGMVTETSRFNLFFEVGDKVFTPSLQSGCLRGVFRQHCLNQGFVEIESKRRPLLEKDFTIDEIRPLSVWVGNSVRGLLKAQVLWDG
jgi:para-aminobenzoate synthetase / 4-amino-4-deoxychorismate lyase